MSYELYEQNYNAILNLPMVKSLIEKNKKLRKENKSLRNLICSIPEFRPKRAKCNCNHNCVSKNDVYIKKEYINTNNVNVVDLTNDTDDEYIPPNNKNNINTHIVYDKFNDTNNVNKDFDGSGSVDNETVSNQKTKFTLDNIQFDSIKLPENIIKQVEVEVEEGEGDGEVEEGDGEEVVEGDEEGEDEGEEVEEGEDESEEVVEGEVEEGEDEGEEVEEGEDEGEEVVEGDEEEVVEGEVEEGEDEGEEVVESDEVEVEEGEDEGEEVEEGEDEGEEVEEGEVEEGEVEEGEGEDEEVFEFEINGKAYYITNEINGIIYNIDENEEVGDQIGILQDGKPIFNK
jgi:hypothetical protein